MLLAPVGVRSWATFIKFGFGTTKDKSNFDVWALLFDQKMFLSITYREDAFSFDIKSAVSIAHFKVWCVASVTSWISEVDFVGLINDR